MSQPTISISAHNRPTFVSTETHSVRRLRAIFASETVPWCAPTNKWDQKSLEETAEKIDEYLRSDDFLLDSDCGTALLTMGSIMLVAGGNEHLAVGCAVRENARAFGEHAWVEWCINERVER